MSSKELELALKIKADLQQAVSDVDQLAGAFDKSRKENEKWNKTSKETNNNLTGIAASVKAVSLTLAAGFGLNEIIRSADAWTAYENRLRLVTDGHKALSTASQDVYKIARQNSQQLDSTSAVYQRFAQNADRLNISLKQSAELTDTVSKAIAISGGSAASGEAALVQFGQALASGVLRGEEFNSVMEQAPGLALALADGLDVNIGKLREMANEGELTADVLVEALERSRASVEEQFETRVRTISQAATEFDTAFTRLVGTMSAGQGAGEGLANVIGGLADVLDTLSDNSEILGLALDTALVLTAGKALSILLGLTAAGLKSVIMTTAATAANANYSRSATAAAIANGLLARSFFQLTAAGGGLLTFLGGPLGVVISLGLAAAAFLDFGGDAEAGMDLAANATEKASVRVRNATRDMIQALQLGDVNTASYDQISQGIETLQEQLKAVVEERHRLQTLQDQDIVFGVTGNLDEAQEKVRSLEAAIRKLQQQQSGERFDGVRAGDKYLENLDRQKDRIENITELEKAQAYLRKQGIDQYSEMGKKILEEAAANDALIDTKRKEQEAERRLQSARNEAQRDIESQLRDQQRFVEQLERQVDVQNLSEQALREYTLAEQGLTGALLARAKAANQALIVQERMNQALQDANALEDIQIQLLRSSGSTVEARALELEQQFGEMLKRLKDPDFGDADGAALIERFIDVELARTRLDEVQAEIDKAFSNQNLSEQTVQTELDAGLITEFEAREKIRDIHKETASILEQQRPLLAEMAQQPGAVGEAATAALIQLDAQVAKLKASSSDLEKSLKEGLSGGIQTAIQGLANGTLTLREAIGSLVQSVANAVTEMLAQMIAQKAVLSLFGGGFGGGAGFSAGGFTGPGAKYDVAGVVHAGEYVQPMEVMQQPGALQFMEAFRVNGMQLLNNFRGYDEGGSVGGGQMLQPVFPAGGGGSNEFNIFNNLDTDDTAQKVFATATAGRSIVNTIRTEKRQIKAILES